MRRKYLRLTYSLFTRILFFYVSLTYGYDTLEILQTFDSPIPNPRALEYDGSHFWISNLQTPRLYKLDENIQIADSLYVPFGRIAGITFKDEEIWVVRDSAIAETLVINNNYDSLYYNVYCIYSLSRINGLTSDSIRFRASATNSTDTNHLLGITYNGTNFYVSYNGGWGPCIYKLYPTNKDSVNRLTGAHPSGMTVIGKQWWAVRENSSVGGDGNRLVSIVEADNGVNEKREYGLDFYACDITYNGSNIWLCDRINSKICKMEKTSVSIETKPIVTIKDLEVSFLNQYGGDIVIKFPNPEKQATLRIYDVHGRVIKQFNNQKNSIIIWNASSCSMGLYLFCVFSGRERFIKRSFIER